MLQGAATCVLTGSISPSLTQKHPGAQHESGVSQAAIAPGLIVEVQEYIAKKERAMALTHLVNRCFEV